MKIHHFLTTLFLAAPICWSQAPDMDADYEEEAAEYEEDEDFGEDYEEPSERTYTAEEAAAAFKQYIAHLQKNLDCLLSITDKASADAAAPTLEELRDNSPIRSLINPLSQHTITEEDGAEITRIMNESDKCRQTLDEAYYYGSEALAEALTGDKTNALAPIPMPPEVQKALSQTDTFKDFNITINEEELQKVVSGGPGFTRETAWVCNTKRSFVAREFATDILMTYSCPVKRAKTEERVIDGKIYCVATAYFSYEGARYSAEVWTDISSACKIYTEEQKQAALNMVVDLNRKLYELLANVHDKATADAAADFAKESNESLTDETKNILDSIDRKVLMEAINAVTPSRDEMYQLFSRLKENDFYGSEKLRDL